MTTVQSPSVKPRLRGVSHQVAFMVALIAGPALLAAATTNTARAAAIVYAAGLITLFGVSTLFHRITWTPAARLRMRRLDHAAIFVFIAATYTPVLGLTLTEGPAVWILPTVWVLAATAVAIKLVWIDAPKPLSAVMYIGLGWLALLTAPLLAAKIGTGPVLLLFAGGVLYTIGAAVFAARTPNPYPTVFGYHEIFHGFVIAAAVCHYACIRWVILPLS